MFRSLIFVISSLLMLSSFMYGNNCMELKIIVESHGDVYVFQGVSDKEISKWYIITGDGTTYENQAIKHRYEKSGVYTVCLRAIANDGCTAGICERIEVKLGNDNECDLGTDFKYDLQGQIITVAARAKDDQNISYKWDFGDGNQAQGQEVRNKFEKTGSYNICVTATKVVSNTGATCSQKVCKTIRVGTNSNTCNIRADFGIEIKNNIITLNGRSSLGNNARYNWSFGDGAQGQGAQTRHAYNQRGTYQVCMTVTAVISTTNVPCEVKVCKRVNIGLPNTTVGTDCNLKVTFQVDKKDNIYSFNATSNERSALYYWSVTGQLTRLEGEKIEYVFEKPGVYEVCVIAISGDGKCKARSCQSITVGRSMLTYPNPASDKITIEGLESFYSIQILDRFANVVFQSYDPNVVKNMDISHLQSGLYTVIVTDNDGKTQSNTLVKH